MEGKTLIYSRKTNTSNSEWMIFDAEMKGSVVKLIRKSNRVIVMRVIIENNLLNIVSTYAVQVGCEEGPKKKFW